MVGYIAILIIGANFAGFGGMLLFLGIFFNMQTFIPGYGPSNEIILTCLILGIILLIIGGINLGIGYAKQNEVKKEKLRRKLKF